MNERKYRTYARGFKLDALELLKRGEYIEGGYNRHRLHSSLGYLSPVDFELVSGH